jgi:hypothetical protein
MLALAMLWKYQEKFTAQGHSTVGQPFVGKMPGSLTGQ